MYTLLHPDEIRSLFAELSDFLIEVGPPDELEPDPQLTPIFTSPPSEAKFEALWRAGTPMVLRSTSALSWYNIDRLKVLFAGRHCFLEDCETGMRSESTVDAFLGRLFPPSGASVQGPPLKLKDYPTDDTLSRMFPPLARHFQRSLPYPYVTSSEGPLNIINSFPADYLSVPDLGPKAYIAMGVSPTVATTRLHMDLCDAVNIMLPVHQSSSATWHIFLPNDAPRLRQYLKDKHSLPEEHDPILEQQFYLDEQDIANLRGIGVHPLVFDQRGGDIVLIPTGAAHQVGP
ncbi:hypothetical protein ONZ45_g17982 [Pleurotus djamor]|nr:hypothetical protein ONZ45_g17982 [Pleurotus djamor]